MTTSWQGARTTGEADEIARKTVSDVAAARKWWEQPTVHAATALDVAAASSDDASEYWAVLIVSWDEAGAQLPLKPDGWDKLAGVWKQAATTTGTALSAEQENSLRTIIGGALSGSVEDAAELTETSAGAFTEVVEAIRENPILAGILLGSGVIVWKAGPAVLAALVARAVR